MRELLCPAARLPEPERVMPRSLPVWCPVVPFAGNGAVAATPRPGPAGHGVTPLAPRSFPGLGVEFPFGFRGAGERGSLGSETTGAACARARARLCGLYSYILRNREKGSLESPEGTAGPRRVTP